MGLRDLIFGKEEEEDDDKPASVELEQASQPKERPADVNFRLPADEPSPRTQQKPVQQRPVEPEVPMSSPELEAELKDLKDKMLAEKKDKGLGQEYYGFLKALGEEDDDEAHQRTLRSVNAVREQFSIGEALTWKSLIDSAKSCMSWLGDYSRLKSAKLIADHRTVAGGHALEIEKAGIAIEEKEAQILKLQKEIAQQKAVQEAGRAAQQKSEQEFERRKLAIDNASVQLATDIANDIAVFQRQN